MVSIGWFFWVEYLIIIWIYSFPQRCGSECRPTPPFPFSPPFFVLLLPFSYTFTETILTNMTN